MSNIIFYASFLFKKDHNNSIENAIEIFKKYPIVDNAPAYKTYHEITIGCNKKSDWGVITKMALRLFNDNNRIQPVQIEVTPMFETIDESIIIIEVSRQ